MRSTRLDGPSVRLLRSAAARWPSPAVDGPLYLEPDGLNQPGPGLGHPAEPTKITLSLIVPIYNEEAMIDLLHREVVRVMEGLGLSWQVIYVDDGSRDRSLELLRQRQQADPRVVVVELSRNWGHQPALTAGLSVAEGDAAILMDGDMQDPPEVIARMVAAWKRARRSSSPSAPPAPRGGCGGCCFRFSTSCSAICRTSRSR